MRALMLTMTLAAVLASPTLAQTVTPGGGIGPVLPKCSAVVPVCQNNCRTTRTQCEAQPKASKQACSNSFTTCFKRCTTVQCAR